jgi:class 3 adenylate cyclase
VVEARVERRLAAILAADIAGYSRLMGVDEEGTLRQLKAHRKELVDPKISEHRGRIVKTAGDGMLVEFVSVVDAVRCAVDIQRNMAERNAEVLAGRQLSNSHALLNFRKKRSTHHGPISYCFLYRHSNDVCARDRC